MVSSFVNVAGQHTILPFFFIGQNKALRPCPCMYFLFSDVSHVLVATMIQKGYHNMVSEVSV